MKQQLKHELINALIEATGLEASVVRSAVEKPKNAAFGDLAFPCFLLAKKWGKSPPECAEQLQNSLMLPSGISEAHIVGPFLNFRFDRQLVVEATLKDLSSQDSLSSAAENQDKKIVLEYSSPNIAKTFHVGHIRGTLIGHALDNIYRFLNYNIETVNHLGDWGTQFGFVWAGCEVWGRPKDESVRALVELYRKAANLKDQQEKESVPTEDANKPDINEMARQYFLDLEEGKSDAVSFWEWCCEISIRYLKDTYARFGIDYDHFTGESFYRGMLEGVQKELDEAGILVESQGALGVDLGEELGFARIYTPDGRSLYLTRDLATAEYRAKQFKFDRALYVVGAPQTLHFQHIKGVLKALGHSFADKIEHIAFGHVGGMSTRAGGAIELNDFLDEANQRALKAYREQVSRRPEGLDENEVAHAVGLAAIIYNTLSRSRIKDVEFSWEHSLEFQGDSGPYLLYAYARINGIEEKAIASGLSSKPAAEHLTDDSAYALATALGEFESVLERVVADSEPAYLANYMHTLAKTFSKAYQELKVVGEETAIAEARLALFAATRKVLGTALELLGIPRIERM